LRFLCACVCVCVCVCMCVRACMCRKSEQPSFVTHSVHLSVCARGRASVCAHMPLPLPVFHPTLSLPPSSLSLTPSLPTPHQYPPIPISPPPCPHSSDTHPKPGKDGMWRRKLAVDSWSEVSPLLSLPNNTARPPCSPCPPAPPVAAPPSPVPASVAPLLSPGSARRPRVREATMLSRSRG